MPFPLISVLWILAALAIAGVLLWGVEQLPIDAVIKTIIRVVVIVILVIWVIYAIMGMVTGIPIR